MILPQHCKEGPLLKRAFYTGCCVTIEFAAVAIAIAMSLVSFLAMLPKRDILLLEARKGVPTGEPEMLAAWVGAIVFVILLLPLAQIDRDIAKDTGVEIDDDSWL